MAAQQRCGGERLQRWNVSGAGHHHIRIAAIVAGPFPDARTGGAMADGTFDVESLPGGLFARDDQVDVTAAAQAMIRDGQEAVRVRRQIDPDNVRLLVCKMSDETRILVGKSVMVLPPHVRSRR